MDNQYIKEKIIKNIRTTERIFKDEVLLFTIDIISKEMAATLKNGNKVLFCGNGLSTLAAQNMANSLSGKISKDRPPLAAISLHSDSNFISNIGSQYGFDEVYARMVLAIGDPDDMLITFCSGNPKNSIINAISMANQIGLKTILIGSPECENIIDICGESIIVGDVDEQRSQECHIFIGNIMCEIVESLIYKNIKN
jgi:D-sedoheptulose 7-phosphate isomerase